MLHAGHVIRPSGLDHPFAATLRPVSGAPMLLSALDFAELGLSIPEQRMGHPVCKRFRLGDLNSLRQRIRPVGCALAKMEIRASRAS